MPHVSHYQLAQIAGTAHLWADEIRAFVDGIAKSPTDRTALGVFADYLDEHDEPELAQAAWFLAKRSDPCLLRGTGKTPMWWVSGLPASVANERDPDRDTNDTPLGALAKLYFKLDAARKSLE